MNDRETKPLRVAVAGAGNVGSTFAYALLLSGFAAELVLIDANRAKVEGEAMDLSHSVPFAQNTTIWAGDYPDCAHAVVTVIAAGVNQKPGETRLDLLRRNAEVFRQVVPSIVEHNPSGILLIANNPVDLLTYASLKLSGLPAHRVMGSGTIRDTARFRSLLSRHFKVDPRSVHAYIIGEHGDSEVPVWSLANIAGMRFEEFSAVHNLPYDRAIMDEIFKQTRDAAYQILQRKGATFYAVAVGLMRVVEAILRDQRTVLSVSSLIEDYYGISNTCLSLPTVVNRRAVEWGLKLKLQDDEIRGLQRSTKISKGNCPPARDRLIRVGMQTQQLGIQLAFPSGKIERQSPTFRLRNRGHRAGHGKRRNPGHRIKHA